jgi:hypothetical protein
MSDKAHGESGIGPADGMPGARPQPAYWIRLLVFLIPLIASEFMFYRIGRGWSLIVFPVAWLGYWYFQMRRGGWNVFDPKAR